MIAAQFSFNNSRSPKTRTALSFLFPCLSLAMLAIVSGYTPVAHAQDLLSQITQCVHVPTAVADTSRRRRATRSECNPADARRKAFEAARVVARNALAPRCQASITAAEARAVCRSIGATTPTTTTSLGRPPVRRAGGPALEGSLPISNGNGPSICAVFDDLPNQTTSNTSANFWCLLNAQQQTNVTARSRAFCGVQCF